MNQVVYGLCMEAARDQMTASYSAVATRIGMDITDDAWWYQIGTLLDEVSRYEHAHGRRLLSVVVVRQDTERPGAGFFAHAKELGAFDGVDEEAFFVEERAAAWAERKR